MERVAVVSRVVTGIVFAAAGVVVIAAASPRARVAAPQANVPTSEVGAPTVRIVAHEPVVEAPCGGDPLLGTWATGATFRGEWRDYHAYTLVVRCVNGALRATLDLDHWAAGDGEPLIPQCASGEYDVVRHHIAARITVDGDRVRIDARDNLRTVASPCGASGEGYSLDHFTGTRDARGNLVMYNTDDGGYAHDRLYQFRRVTPR
jgi:hypothetical protein